MSAVISLQVCYFHRAFTQSYLRTQLIVAEYSWWEQNSGRIICLKRKEHFIIECNTDIRNIVFNCIHLNKEMAQIYVIAWYKFDILVEIIIPLEYF